MLDGLNAIQSALADLSDPEKMAIAAREACDAALNEFLKRPNCAGRARMFAERSIGLPDPGMLALRRLLDAI